MKTRESGMPDEQMWEEYFNTEYILNSLGVINLSGNVVDFGCGYGTFTIPAAKRTKGLVYAIDIDEQMINITTEKVRKYELSNIKVIARDFFTKGTGLDDNCCEFAMLFNILHAENPIIILNEAKRILSNVGKVGVIHWNYDPSTPRGPSMNIRPRPEQCKNWIIEAGFTFDGKIIDLPPYHYGLVGRKEG